MSKAIKKGKQQEMETVATSTFPPMWKPEKEGESVDILPVSINQMELKRGKKKQTTFSAYCIWKGGGSENFYVGSGKNQIQQEMKEGDTCAIPLSSVLVGENDPYRLAVQKEEDGPLSFSPLVEVVQKEGLFIRLVYKGTVGLGGGQKFKRIDIQTPKGVRERVMNIVATSVKSGKSGKKA